MYDIRLAAKYRMLYDMTFDFKDDMLTGFTLNGGVRSGFVDLSLLTDMIVMELNGVSIAGEMPDFTIKFGNFKNLVFSAFVEDELSQVHLDITEMDDRYFDRFKNIAKCKSNVTGDYRWNAYMVGHNMLNIREDLIGVLKDSQADQFFLKKYAYSILEDLRRGFLSKSHGLEDVVRGLSYDQVIEFCKTDWYVDNVRGVDVSTFLYEHLAYFTYGGSSRKLYERMKEVLLDE